MQRRVTGLACLSLAALLAAVPADAATCGRAKAVKAGTWFAAKPPIPPHTGLRDVAGVGNYLKAFAVDPASTATVFATDGLDLHRSNDGGCTWARVYSLPEAPGITTPDREVGEIASIDVTRVNGRTRVLLAVHSVGWHLPATYRTVVVRSDDGYRDWSVVSDPVTFAGVFNAYKWRPAIRSAGNVVYAAIPGAASGVAYVRSTDGGTTWTARTPPTDDPPDRVVGFAVNPWDPDELWEWGGHDSRSRAGAFLIGLRHSTDGGGSWTAVDPWPAYEDDPSWWSADVFWPRRGAPARLVITGDGSGQIETHLVSWSSDGGRSFQLALPPNRNLEMSDTALTHLPNGDPVVVTNNRMAFRIVSRGRVPRGTDWRPLPMVPLMAQVRYLNYQAATASASWPASVAVGTGGTVQLLAVAR